VSWPARVHSRFVTDESAKRRQLYQAQITRDDLERDFVGTSEQFLAELGLAFTIEPARARTCSGRKS